MPENTQPESPPMPRDEELRGRARELLRNEGLQTSDWDTTSTLMKVLEELQVHQVELQIQNDTLLQEQARRDASEARFQHLYDLTPIGYVILNEAGVILDANAAACITLQTSPNRIRLKNVFRFLAPGDERVFRAHLKEVFAGEESVTCEVTLAESGIGLRVRSVLDPAGFSSGAPPALLAEEAEEGEPGKTCLCALADITDEIRARERVRDNLRFYQQILNSITHKLAVINPNTFQIELANSAFGGEATVGKACYAVHPDECLRDREDGGCPLQQVIETRSVATRRKIIHGSHGETRHLDVYAYPVFGANGEVATVLKQQIDVTEQVQMAETAREHVERFAEVVRLNRTITWEAAPDGRMTYINPVVENVLGIKPDEVCGTMTLLDFYQEKDRARVQDAWRDALAVHGEIKNLVAELRARDGRRVWLSTTAVPILAPDGTLQGYRGIDIDITDHKLAEDAKAVRESYRQMQTILDSLDAVVYIADFHTYEILLMNQYARQIFGDCVGRTCYENLQADASAPCAFCPNPLLLSEEGTPTGVHVWEQKNSLNHRWYDVRSSLIPWSDGKWVKLEIWTDITQRKRAEEELQAAYDHSARTADALHAVSTELRQTLCISEALREEADQSRAEAEAAMEEAEDASRFKSAFLSNMSHEIRTPLNAIIGFSNLLKRDADLEASEVEYVHTIVRSGEHLLRLINDILSLSKIESGNVAFQPNSFSLAELIRDLERMMRSPIEAKGVALQVEVAADVPRFVEADEGKLRQVLINLLGNANKFTAHGSIVLRVATDAPPPPGVEDERQACLLRFEVEDTGIGVPEEAQASIFESFRQTEAGVNAGGTGLGLAISQRNVALMGGAIHVESTLDEGSRFWFTCPVTPVPYAPEEGDACPLVITGIDAPGKVYRVLIVDDKQENRRLLVSLLDKIGFLTEEAASGEEALRLVATEPPDILLLDMRMPGMDGFDVARRIRKSAQGQDTPIIAITAYAFEDEKDRILACGVNGYIRKPFKLSSVLDALRTHLNLRYTYSYSATPASRDATDETARIQAALETLDEATREKLLEACMVGDAGWIRSCAASLDAHAPALGHAIRTFVKRYDYDGLRQVLTLGKREGIE